MYPLRFLLDFDSSNMRISSESFCFGSYLIFSNSLCFLFLFSFSENLQIEEPLVLVFSSISESKNLWFWDFRKPSKNQRADGFHEICGTELEIL
jgi:hypothetical protein